PRRIAENVRSVDLLPTLCELFDVADPAASLREGVSLVPFLLGKARTIPADLAEIRLKDGFHANALVDDGHKLYEDVSNERFLLFDLAGDPHERHDLAAIDAGRLARMKAELAKHIDAASAKGAAIATQGNMELPLDVRERLRGLGYDGVDRP